MEEKQEESEKTVQRTRKRTETEVRKCSWKAMKEYRRKCKYVGINKYRYKMVSRPPTMMRLKCIPGFEKSLHNKRK